MCYFRELKTSNGKKTRRPQSLWQDLCTFRPNQST